MTAVEGSQGGEEAPPGPRPQPKPRFLAQSNELTSLDERLGLLLIVRVCLVAVVAGASVFDAGQLHAHLGQVGPLCLSYLVLSALVEGWRRRQVRYHLSVHRAMLPIDAVFLILACTPSGGAASPFAVMFAVHLVAVTLLGSQRAGLRMVLWDTLLLVAVPALDLYQRVGDVLGVTGVVVPHGGAVAVSVCGLWAIGVCTALFSSVSERELRRSKAEMAALAEMAAEVEEAAEEEEILVVLLRSMSGGFPIRRAALWYLRDNRPLGLLLKEPGGEVRPVPVPPMARADRVAAAAWEGNFPHLVRRLDYDEDPVACGLLPDASNVIVLPLHIDGDLSGLVLLEHGGNPLNARIPRRTLLVLVQFVAHAALALRNARLLAERSRLAVLDGLTGLANRRELDRVLEREASRSERSGEPLSLIVFDVDHFKSVNDTRGHLGGDEVLRAIAAVLRESVRDMDLAARYGGEEFAAVLPRCDLPGAARVAERVAAGISKRPDLEGVTVSAGVATMPLNAGTPVGLVAAADEALYESKHNGRNRFTLSRRSAAGADAS